MKQRIGYKTIKWETSTNFQGEGVTTNIGPGRIVFTNLENLGSMRGLVFPVFAVSFFSPSARPSVELSLQNAENRQDRRVLLDANAVTDFVEDNLGQGWPVPYIEGRGGNRYELILTTTGGDEDQTAIVEVWWRPVETLEHYQCRAGLARADQR